MPAISTCPRCQQQVSVPQQVDSAALVRCPLCHAEYPLSESLELAPPELIPVVLAAAAEEAEAPAAPVVPTASGEYALEKKVEEKDAEHSEATAVVGQYPAMPYSARRRGRRPKSALQTLIEVVTGGLAGCLVAYYGLAFYYGPQFHQVGIPKLPLPFIEWITAPPLNEDYIKVEQPAEEKPTKPKPVVPPKTKNP